jgi:hypothetical protein
VQLAVEDDAGAQAGPDRQEGEVVDHTGHADDRAVDQLAATSSIRRAGRGWGSEAVRSARWLSCRAWRR